MYVCMYVYIYISPCGPLHGALGFIVVAMHIHIYKCNMNPVDSIEGTAGSEFAPHVKDGQWTCLLPQALS